VTFDGGEGLTVASGKSGKLLQLGKTGKDVRWQSIRSKEDKGTREVDLTEVGQGGDDPAPFRR
jgi:hypothetical protein